LTEIPKAVDSELSISGGGGIERHLDRVEVLRSTVEQLRKDLALDAEQLPLPAVGDEAFELLREAVLPVLEALEINGAHALQVAMYRVDIPEAHLRRTMAYGGLQALAGEVVLRALQKVLTRLRYAGRF
jgi:hypothetical protein